MKRETILRPPEEPDFGFRYGTEEEPDVEGWGTLPPGDSSKKGRGYYGLMRNTKGQDVSEFSIGVTIKGNNYHVPSLVPGLTRREIDEVLSGEVSESVERKATAWALKRINEGRPVFATLKEEGRFTPVDEQ